MRALTLGLLILGAWVLLVLAEFGPVLFSRSYHLGPEDLIPAVLILCVALMVGLVAGCFVTRERPFRPALVGVAVIASVAVSLVLFVALSLWHGGTFAQAAGGSLFYLPGICIFSIPAAVSCLLAQSCRSACLRRQR